MLLPALQPFRFARHTRAHRLRTLGLSALALCAGAATGCDALCAALGLTDQQCRLLVNQPSVTDLNVVVEVRFIAVEDSFFEEIGVDFDLEVDAEPVDDSNPPPQRNAAHATLAPPGRVGGPENREILIPMETDADSLLLPVFPVNQDTPSIIGFPGLPGLGVTVPPNGSADQPDFDHLPGGIKLDSWSDADFSGFGFAILSDIEAFFFLEAAQGDEGNAVLTAPKVTLFNGQSATIVTRNENTLVTDLIPTFRNAVTDFDPTITTVTSGPMLKVEPVISADRRFITMQITPIQAVVAGLGQAVDTGTGDGAIQFPIVRFSTVSTTVSVPDGGTVLLGGIRRASDGQYERGVPVLNKLPYVNRLFRNTGEVRDTHTLLIMVTPRIIIQEEEE